MKARSKQHRNYSIICAQNEHGGYTVTVPALPGLVTEGKNLEDAKRMVKDAIRCYVEGLRKANQKILIERETAQLRVSVLA